ncbi:hypothetical protein E3N88_28547 [Mikania micrantha]|uniref:Integrase catalytic domain-containing protein n=1 Tax=Mikania micrantha TaxID=192012 RepID=A0A5N6N0S8_9ASTR|nr:hypothetical protein E3N88_28547 [Mikania micrantha]
MLKFSSLLLHIVLYLFQINFQILYVPLASRGKSSKLSLPNSNFRNNHVLDLVYCDVWGPAPTLSIDGCRFFLLCVDHHTRYMWFYPLVHKSDVFSALTNFIKMSERQFNTKLKSIQSYWGGEFRNLTHFFNNLGIIHRRSCPYTSEQNGIIERRHRHVVETGLTLLAQSHLPQRFRQFAFETAVYLINRLPSRVSSNKSPFEHLFKIQPNYSFLRVFGCQCFPYLRPYNHHKMDFRSTPCVFIGYSPIHHGYRCFDPKSERIYVARHVRFNEHFFPFHHLPPVTPSSTTEPPCISIFPDLPPDFSVEPSTSPTSSTPSNPPDQTESISAEPTSSNQTAQTKPISTEPTSSSQPDQSEYSSAIPQTSTSASNNPQTNPPP